MSRKPPVLRAPTTDDSAAPLSIIRTETALSRFPVHRIAKRGDVTIEIKNQAAAVLWEVTHNSKYGQPGPLAYKLDTVVINRTIEETGKPVPKLLRLGSLKEIAAALDLGRDTNTVKTALLQNAFAAINAKISYKAMDKSERFLEAAFTRYSVLFTGETLPDGRKADAVYLLLNDIYQQVLNEAQTRPLDYEYMKALPPAAQRFYEIASYQIYAALLHNNPRAKLTYSDYCTLSTQTRYLDWDHVKKQMYKVHMPHLRSGYLAKVEYEAITDVEGKPDWNMLYTPGPNAAAEFRAFKGGGNRAVQKLAKKQPFPSPAAEAIPLPFPKPLAAAVAAPTSTTAAAAPKKAEPESLDPETAALVAELVARELNHATAVLYAKGDPQECRRQLTFISAMREEDFTEGRGAYLARAIPEKWGPPKRYKERQRREEAARKKIEAVAHALNAPQSPQDARRAALVAEGMQWIGRLEKEAPEAFCAFCAQVERELQMVLGRFKGEKAQESYRRLYAEDKKRVELLLAYLTQNPCALLPELARWTAQSGPELKRLVSEG